MNEVSAVTKHLAEGLCGTIVPDNIAHCFESKKGIDLARGKMRS
jgi:hypothetical protein